MDVETITKLLDAGYTKAEIDKLQGGDNPSNESDEGAGKEVAPTIEKPSNASAENAGAVDLTDTIKVLSDTVDGLVLTVKAMQESNVKGAATDSPKASDKIKAAMDSFIENL